MQNRTRAVRTRGIRTAVAALPSIITSHREYWTEFSRPSWACGRLQAAVGIPP
ncbi:hypothetical protein [Streptomyces massasporeus]|uniref:hypothetical protein n=1 Tax=Streptomyces massasporeus TaxID=67324 RepID=UPI001671A419|nr:hypothetical protein [Streptomyces massasporeus]